MPDAHPLHEVVITLEKCRQKLVLYRQKHSGEYVGGQEFTSLMQRIAGAIVIAIDQQKVS